MYEHIIVLYRENPANFGQRLKENANTIQIRPENFEDVLREMGFGPAQRLGVTGEGGRAALVLLGTEYLNTLQAFEGLSTFT